MLIVADMLEKLFEYILVKESLKCLHYDTHAADGAVFFLEALLPYRVLSRTSNRSNG